MTVMMMNTTLTSSSSSSTLVKFLINEFKTKRKRKHLIAAENVIGLIVEQHNKLYTFNFLVVSSSGGSTKKNDRGGNKGE